MAGVEQRGGKARFADQNYSGSHGGKTGLGSAGMPVGRPSS